MHPFLMSYEALVKDFVSKDIPIDKPGFYNHPNFLKAEQRDSDYLNHYMAFVAKRPYEQDYLQYAKEKIQKIALLLYHALKENGRLGACIDISNILSAICEQEGIWSCCIGGSLAITFPNESLLSPLHFFSIDYGDFVAGHAWVFAPPYAVIDISLGQQPNIAEKAKFLSPTVLSLGMNSQRPPVSEICRDIISNEVATRLGNRHSLEQVVLEHCPNIPDIFHAFPVVLEQEQCGTTLKYIPVNPGCPDCCFEEFRTMSFAGMTPYEFYTEKLRSLLGC